MEISPPSPAPSLTESCGDGAPLTPRQAVGKIFPDVITSPYLMTGASDSRFMSRVSDCCLRFAPFRITQEQMDSVHGIDENIDIHTLAPAVDFYRFLMTEV